MDPMPWTALVFQSIPEAIILVALGLALVGEYPRMRDISLIGIFEAVFSFYCRRLELDFGVHTLVQILVLILLIRIIAKTNIIKSIISAILGTIVLGVVEGISIPVVSHLTGISIEVALKDPWLRVLFPLPDEIILAVMAYICRKRRFSLLSDKSTIKPS